MSSPFYVERLILRNIRCFEHLDIQFNKPGESIVIIGDNGDGKSTILRSLAMGICDQSSASALFRELHGEYVRTGSSEGTIEVELKGRGRDRYRIVTNIKFVKGFAFERVEQKLFRITVKRKKWLNQDNFPWERIFASGYGPGIRVQGTSDFDSHLTVDAVYSLFRYDVLLQNPELIVRRIIDAARQKHGDQRAEDMLTEIKTLLARVLQLKEGPGHIHLEPHGIYVGGSRERISLAALADGFRGTVTWVLDLVSWWFLYGREEGSARFLDVHGIVLIDEVEQHLHPLWQRNIMGLLKESFPNVQFIATTHSPLVASGCKGIPVHNLAQGSHSIKHPFGWLAEDVYRMMGLEEGSRSAGFRNTLDQIRELDLRRISRKATRADLNKLRKLKQRLEDLPGSDPVQAIIAMESIRRLLETSKSESDKHDKTDA